MRESLRLCGAACVGGALALALRSGVARLRGDCAEADVGLDDVEAEIDAVLALCDRRV